MNDAWDDDEAWEREYDLKEKRRCLVENLNAIRDIMHDQGMARIETASRTGRDQALVDYTDKEQIAASKLDAFDADHPEIRVALEADRKARIARAD